MEIKIYRAVLDGKPLTNWLTDKEELYHCFVVEHPKRGKITLEEGLLTTSVPFRSTVESIAGMCRKYSANGEFTDARARDFLNNVRVKCNDAIEYALKHGY